MKRGSQDKDCGSASRGAAFRIAHFGDMHLEDFDAEYEWVLGMVEDAVERGAHHVVFTGDIVDIARIDIIESLFDDLEVRGFGPDWLSFVPGNHDIYPLSAYASLEAIRGLARTAMGEAQRNWEVLCRLSERLHGEPVGSEDGFPWVKRLAPGIVLAGLDTTRSITRNPMRWAEGQLDEDAVDALARAFERFGDVSHRVVAMHHYPLNDFRSWSEWFPMQFADPAAAVARNWLSWMGATSVLCGHIHEDRERTISDGISVFCTDSGLYEFGDDHELTGRGYRMIALRPGKKPRSSIIEVNE